MKGALEELYGPVVATPTKTGPLIRFTQKQRFLDLRGQLGGNLTALSPFRDATLWALGLLGWEYLFALQVPLNIALNRL